MKIIITKMMVGDFEVPVPYGLSELVQDCWVPERNRYSDDITNKYERVIEKRNGRLYTILTPKRR